MLLRLSSGSRRVEVCLDHDAFSSNRAEGMTVIVFNTLEHDVTQKPVPTFWHHALVQPSRRYRLMVKPKSAEAALIPAFHANLWKEPQSTVGGFDPCGHPRTL